MGSPLASAAETEMVDVPVEGDTTVASSALESAVTPRSSAASAASLGGGSSIVAAVPVVGSRPTHERGPDPFGDVVPLLNQEWPYLHL